MPKDHPLRTLRALVDGILANMSALFDERYSHTGRPSIPPEQLLRALLVQILFTIRSERQLVEQLDYNLLFRWFVGLGMDDAVWDRTVFSINRDRLLGTDVARQFFRRVLHLAEWQGFVSDEHFSVDGTLIEAWASHKSFVPKDGSGPDKPAGAPGGRLQGQDAQQRHHQSHYRPQMRGLQKWRVREAKLCYMAHRALRERNELVVDVEARSHGTRRVERTIRMIDRSWRKPGATVGGTRTMTLPSSVADSNVAASRHSGANGRGSSAVDGPRRRGNRATR